MATTYTVDCHSHCGNRSELLEKPRLEGFATGVEFEEMIAFLRRKHDTGGFRTFTVSTDPPTTGE